MSTLKLTISQPTKQQLADYANAMISVNSYAYGITNQNLPVLTHPPKNYADFSTQFVPAKQHALNWSNVIFVNMIQLPKTIKDQTAGFFDMEANMIDAYLNALIDDPTNATAKKGLATALTALQTSVNAQVTTISNIESELETFAKNIGTDADTLVKIATEALDAAKGDKAQIVKINKDIASLNSQIKTAQTVLTVGEIAIGLGIFIAAVGAVVAFIPGAQGVGIGIIVGGLATTGAGIAVTVIEKENIKAMQAQIASDGTQIKEYDQDIVLLNNVATQFLNLREENLKAQKALKVINTQWDNLACVIGEVKSELADVAKDNSSADYKKAQADFKAAENNWAEVVSFANSLAGLSYNWQDSSGNWHNYGNQAPTADASKVLKIKQPASAAVA